MLLLQRAGSAYVRAAQGYADATTRIDSTAVEVASQVLVGAAHAVARNNLDAGMAARLAEVLAAADHDAGRDTAQTRSLVLIMRNDTRISTTLALLLAPITLAAQSHESCPRGPGAALGISAYQCANCGFKQGDRPIYSFLAEPVVVETNRATGINAGDVIEAVNGKPITTGAGAEQFTYPPAGIKLDRDSSRTGTAGAPASRSRGRVESPRPGERAGLRLNPDDIEIHRSDQRRGGDIPLWTGGFGGCSRDHHEERSVSIVAIGTGRLAADSAARANCSAAMRQQRGSEPLLVIDGVVMGRTLPTPAAPAMGRFGFAFTCEPSCTVWTGRDGALIYTYYKYRSFPPITAIRSRKRGRACGPEGRRSRGEGGGSLRRWTTKAPKAWRGSTVSTRCASPCVATAKTSTTRSRVEFASTEPRLTRIALAAY